MQEEIDLARKWLRYFARPAKHYAPRSCEDYASRVSRWAGVPIRPDAFLKAATQLNYESRLEADGRHRIKAAIA